MGLLKEMDANYVIGIYQPFTERVAK